MVSIKMNGACELRINLIRDSHGGLAAMTDGVPRVSFRQASIQRMAIMAIRRGDAPCGMVLRRTCSHAAGRNERPVPDRIFGDQPGPNEASYECRR